MYTFSKYIFLLIYVLCYTINCAQEKVKTKVIYGKKIEIKDELGRPNGLIIVNEKVVISDKAPVNDENQIRIYDLKNNVLIAKTGRFGGGPTEFKSINCIANVVGSKKLFTVLDEGLWRYSIFELFHNNTLTLRKIYNLKIGMPYCPTMVGKNTILSPGFGFQDGRFAEIDTLGKIRKYIGITLIEKSKSVPISVIQDAQEGCLKVSPDGSRIVVSALLSDIIDIYDSKGELIKRTSGPKNLKPQFTIQVGKLASFMIPDVKKAIVGYIDIVLTNDKIFALYAGHLYRSKPIEGDQLHIFNLKGDLMKVITVDAKLVKIAYESQTKKLYGIGLNPLPALYSFSINE